MKVIKEKQALSGIKFVLASLAWWLVLLVYGTFAVYYLGILRADLKLQDSSILIDPYLGIVATLALLFFGIYLYWKKPKDWMAMLVSMMLVSGSGFSGILWFWIGAVARHLGDFQATIYAWYDYSLTPYYISLYFEAITNLILLWTFLTFPSGRWVFRKAAWVLFTCFGVLFGLAYAKFDVLYGFATYFILIIGCVFQIIHYYKIPNSIERQQIKWIVITFVLCTIVNGAAWVAAVLEITLQANYWLEFTNIFYYLLIAFALSISFLRYRLWDFDIFINKALVYSTLTGLLWLLGVVSLAVVDFFVKKLAGDDQSLNWGLVISVFPIAAAFNPLRDRLQAFIDLYLKPEEVDFNGTFIEFTPAVREILTTEIIIKTIASQVKKQLKVDIAEVYLYQGDDQLHYVTESLAIEENTQLILDEKQLAQLQAGEIVADDNGAAYSLLVPLTVPRANIPDFIGVILLGRRLSGSGYSTPILYNLRALGADAGKAIYLSQISTQSKQKIAA